MVSFSEQQVTSISPDHKLDAAKKILDLSLWTDLSACSNTLWGMFQGSEKTPYQVALTSFNNADTLPQIQWSCTCKSRKQPCKHVLALMLLSSDEHNFQLVQNGDEPDFVKKLIGVVKYPEAQALRLEKRFDTVLEGADFLEKWLKSSILVGINDGKQEWLDNDTFAELSRRLVDFQAPNLALKCTELWGFIQENKLILTFGEANTISLKFLDSFSELFMICRALHSYDQMPAEWQAELRRLVGIREKKANILMQPGMRDAWLILFYRGRPTLANCDKDSQVYMTDGTYWAYGLTSNHFVQLKFFSPDSDHVESMLVEGRTYVGDMYLYPGVGSIRRALFKPDNMSLESFEANGAGKGMPYLSALKSIADLKAGNSLDQDSISNNGYQNFEQLFAQRSQYYATNPFADNFVALVHNVHLAHLRIVKEHEHPDDCWYIVDSQGKALLTDMSNPKFMALDKIVNGKEFSAFVFFKDNLTVLDTVDEVSLLGVMYKGKYHHQQSERDHIIAHDELERQRSESFMNVLAQSKLGTVHDVLDLSLFDEPLRSELQQIIEHSSDKEEAFFKVARSVLILHKINSVRISDSSALDHMNYASASSPTVKGTLASSQTERAPYFPQKIMNLISELSQLKDQIRQNYSDAEFGFRGFFNFLDFWFLQQLITTKMQFSPEQNKVLILASSEDMSNSFTISSNWYSQNFGFNGDYPLFCALQRVEMLLQLGGEPLRRKFPFLVDPSISYYRNDVTCLNKLLSKDGVVDADCCLNYERLFEAALGSENGAKVVQVLAMLRQKDPALACKLFEKNLDLLISLAKASDYDSEFSLHSCIRTFAINISQNDEDFLNTLRKKISIRNLKDLILYLLDQIPQSKLSTKCMKLWNKYISFNEASDMWDISEIKHSSAFTSLGIAKQSSSNDDETSYLLYELFTGMDFNCLKQVTKATDTKEALRRLTLLPGFTRKNFAFELSNKMIYALATEDAKIASQDLQLIRVGVLPLSLLDIPERKRVIEIATQVCDYTTRVNDFFSVELKDGRLHYNLIEDDDLLKFLLEHSLRSGNSNCIYAFLVKAMSTQCIPWLKQRIEVYENKVNRKFKYLKFDQVGPGLTAPHVDSLKALVSALEFKQHVLDVLDGLKHA